MLYGLPRKGVLVGATIAGKIVMILVGGVWINSKADMQVYLALLLVALMIIAHPIANP